MMGIHTAGLPMRIHTFRAANGIRHAYGHTSGPYERPTRWAVCGRTTTDVPCDTTTTDTVTCAQCVGWLDRNGIR